MLNLKLKRESIRTKSPVPSCDLHLSERSTSLMESSAEILLSDDQVRRYIADGFIILESGVEPSLHSSLTSQLKYVLENELPHPGDNILPRVPDLNKILQAPAVRGALESLLGKQYVLAPHRFPHNSEPGGDSKSAILDPFEDQPKMGKGSISSSGWHQDGHSRAGRSRWHTSRAANIFYFAHDTPLHMGPTRFLAGSHLYASLVGSCAEQVVMQTIPAGSLVIAHFDLGHAGTPNNSDRCRYMVKFVALRTINPTVPSWDNRETKWVTPDNLKTQDDIPSAWISLWNWLRGAPRRENLNAPATEELPLLKKGMQSNKQSERLKCLYDLVSLGDAAVPELISVLLATAGEERHISPPATDRAYAALSSNHLDRRFSERQFVPEDAAIALAAIGKSAIDFLLPLLEHQDPWIRLNAAYALGDMSSSLQNEHIQELTKLLNDPMDCVVRVVLDAFTAIGKLPASAVREKHKLLLKSREIAGEKAAGETLLGLDWTVEHHFRYLICLSLLACASNPAPPIAELEAALIEGLQDELGYAPAVACVGLERLGTKAGMRAAIQYLQVCRWDAPRHTSRSQEGSIAKRHREYLGVQLPAA